MCVVVCVCARIHPQNELVTNFGAITEVLDDTFEVAAVTQNPPLRRLDKARFFGVAVYLSKCSEQEIRSLGDELGLR
jgi:hypothetical protein